MIRWLIGHPEALSGDLAERFPELGQLGFRRGGFPPRIAGWCLGRRSVAAITLWNTIWLGERTAMDAELLLHEARHAAQFEASWSFPLEYLWESLRHGYWNNRFEVDARAYASQRVTNHAQMDR